MNQYWIKQENNKHCILFFNGWGMDENSTLHLFSDGYDICVFYDYNATVPFTLNTEFYDKVFVVAWSLGVWAAAKTLANHKLTIEKSIALNGTLSPIHSTKGILPDIFSSTLEHWNTENRMKFYRRMFGGRKQYDELKQSVSTRTIENQKAELSYLESSIYANPNIDFRFDCAYIGRHDHVFPVKNQLNFWANKTRIVESDSAHYPFSCFNNWSDIIKL